MIGLILSYVSSTAALIIVVKWSQQACICTDGEVIILHDGTFSGLWCRKQHIYLSGVFLYVSYCHVEHREQWSYAASSQYNDNVCLLLQGPVTHVRTVSIGEKRQPAANTHTIVNKNHALITPASKSTPGTRYAAALVISSISYLLNSL